MTQQSMEAPLPRQTLSYLRDLFASRGIRPHRKLGQCFLIDLNVMDLLVRAAELGKEDTVFEVGTGTGSLTSRLCAAAGAVVSVEIDLDFYTLASEGLVGRDNVVLMRGDILRNKNALNEEVLATLDDVQKRSGSARFKLVANLPYAVATPVMANLLLRDQPPERMVVMVQAEIAHRLVAEPGSKDYGALSVLVQALAEVSLVRDRLPPAVFWPRPQVDSAIVLVRPDESRRAIVGDPLKLRHFLRDLYSHRRKNLRGALVGWPGGRRDKVEVDRKLAELQIEGTVRAEDLDVAQHLRLCEMFGAQEGE